VEAERLARYLPALDGLANRLGSLVDDLLDVSRLRLGQLPFRPAALELGALVRAVAVRDGEQAPPEQPLLLDLPPGACWVNADADRLEQVLTNLLDNARKYSPAGGAIHLELQPDGEGVVLRVRDAGIGLPPGSAETIFTPFGRAANALTRQLPGLGLGLYLCREIITQHGGRIWADSPGEDQGTTVSIWLPASTA
jgi:signal transduction histidine kinase